MSEFEQYNDKAYSDKITALKERMQKSIDVLTELEKVGDKNSGEQALWDCYYAWNGKEYEELEKMIKQRVF